MLECTCHNTAAWITLFVHPPPCVGCSLIEQKIDQLADRAADLTKRQLERADTALEYKRCMHVCCNGGV